MTANICLNLYLLSVKAIFDEKISAILTLKVLDFHELQTELTIRRQGHFNQRER